MERDSRERERGGARSDVASLWIDFLLLPQKLEDHLAAGLAAVPPPADLISMFLEQALVSHKSTLVNSSTNSATIDAEPHGAVKGASKTASLLCERAARVAVVMQLNLSEIESSISSQLHQFVLLKALIKHDKGRSLLHQCNLHRWLLHKALQSHPVGSASPNVVLPANRLRSWVTGDDLSEVFHGLIVANGDMPPPSSTAESPIEEESASVEFLEKVLLAEESSLKHEGAAMSQNDHNTRKETSNGISNKEHSLSSAYKCQVMLDVAEVHFMRGRIRKASDFFLHCEEMLTFLSVGEHSTATDDREGRGLTSVTESSGTVMSLKELPVPRDRLAGYIIACKMLLGALPDGKIVEKVCSSKCSDDPGSSSVGVTFRAQWAVIACEHNRMAARKYGSTATIQSDDFNGASDGTNLSLSKTNMDAAVIERTSSISPNKVVEDSNTQLHSSKKSRKRAHPGEANGELTPNDTQQEKNENNGYEPVRPHKDTTVNDMQDDQISVSNLTGLSVGQLANGVKPDPQDNKMSQQVVRTWDWKSVDIKGEEPVVKRFCDTESKVLVDIEKDEQTKNLVPDCHNLEVQLFVDLNGDPREDFSPQMAGDVNRALSHKPENRLVQSFVDDILRRQLSWGYCLSVEKDPMLSNLVRAKLAACNAVRSILEGAPVESFLRVSDHFEDSKDAVNFLLRLLFAVKVNQAGHKQAMYKSSRADSQRNEGPLESSPSQQKLSNNGDSCSDISEVSLRVTDLAMYACCVVDKPWCWALAVQHRLVGQMDLPLLSIGDPLDIHKVPNSSGSMQETVTGLDSMENSDLRSPENPKLFELGETLLNLAEAENVHDIEVLVRKMHKMAGRWNDKPPTEMDEGHRKLPQTKIFSSIDGVCQHCHIPGQSELMVLQTRNTTKPNNAHGNQICSDICKTCWSEAFGQDRLKVSDFDAVAAVLRRRAFYALEIMKGSYVARRLYELALTCVPRDCDSAMMMWLLDCSDSEGHSVSHGASALPKKVEDNFLPNFGLLEFAILRLIDKEQWSYLSELLKWAVSSIEPLGRDGDQITMTEKDVIAGRFTESVAVRQSGWQLRCKRLLHTCSVARILVELMPRCISFQIAASRNHYNEDVARLGSSLSQLFEEFICVLVSGDSDGQVQGNKDPLLWRSTQAGMGPALLMSLPGVPLIAKVSNPRVLMALASLTAGWLQRCHVLSLTPCPLAVDRYGVLAGVTAGASLPPPVGSLPYAGSILRLVPPRVPPEFGKDLFGLLSESIVHIPGFVEGDRELGHRWLQGLADLAFEDEAHLKALRLYLQAGAIRSAQYCDRASSMNRDVFTPCVIQRMVTACRAIGAGIQAAVLCQCLPIPDHESAFRILQENVLIMDRDAASYFECIWEIPILELLVHMHSKAGDEDRVNCLIGLLQQPALNVHNSAAIRQAHISSMEQRFLKRLAGELL